MGVRKKAVSSHVYQKCIKKENLTFSRGEFSVFQNFVDLYDPARQQFNSGTKSVFLSASVKLPGRMTIDKQIFPI